MPRRSTLSLTKRLVVSLDPRPGKDFIIWDREVSGFGVRVKETGTKSFVVKYRNEFGAQRKLSLGQFGAITVEHARRLARTELGKVADGDDPVDEARRARQAQTIEQLCDQYLKHSEAGVVLYRGRPKKKSSLKIDRGRITRHIKPLLGAARIGELTRLDVQNFMQMVRDGKTAGRFKTRRMGLARVAGGPGTAKKAVQLLSTIYNYAIREGLADTNPCTHIPMPIDKRRTRFLTPVEYGRLGAAIAAAEADGVDRTHVLAIRVLLLTGCRRSEILNLKRSEVDFDGRCLRFDDTKTGAQMRPCGASALSILRDAMQSHAGAWVFPASRSSGRIEGIRKHLLKMTAAAELVGVTPHVFRHSFATVAHELGYSELTIAGLLGHRLSSVTSRYAHHVDHVLSDAADKLSAMVAARLAPGAVSQAA